MYRSVDKLFGKVAMRVPLKKTKTIRESIRFSIDLERNMTSWNKKSRVSKLLDVKP